MRSQSVLRFAIVFLVATTMLVATDQRPAPAVSLDVSARVSSPFVGDFQRVRDAPVFWISGSGEQNFREQVLSTVASSPASLPLAIDVFEGMRARAAAGVDLSLGDAGDAAQDRKQLDSVLVLLRDALKQPRLERRRSLEVADIPDNYPIRGSAIRDRRAWRFKTSLFARVCQFDCETTDLITVTWTMDPGRTADRFGFNALYSPNGGNFINIFGLGGVYCNENECATDLIGDGGAQNGTGSGQEFLKHRSMAGGRVADLVRLRGYLVPARTILYDRARTGTARCRTGKDRSCVY